MVGEAREGAKIHTVGGQEAGEREQVGIADRVVLAQKPGSLQHVVLDHAGMRGHRLRHLVAHGGDCLGVVRPAMAAHPVRMGDMHG
jgi:hypothetical protein